MSALKVYRNGQLLSKVLRGYFGMGVVAGSRTATTRHTTVSTRKGLDGCNLDQWRESFLNDLSSGAGVGSA